MYVLVWRVQPAISSVPSQVVIQPVFKLRVYRYTLIRFFKKQYTLLLASLNYQLRQQPSLLNQQLIINSILGAYYVFHETDPTTGQLIKIATKFNLREPNFQGGILRSPMQLQHVLCTMSLSKTKASFTIAICYMLQILQAGIVYLHINLEIQAMHTACC